MRPRVDARATTDNTQLSTAATADAGRATTAFTRATNGPLLRHGRARSQASDARASVAVARQLHGHHNSERPALPPVGLAHFAEVPAGDDGRRGRALRLRQ